MESKKEKDFRRWSNANVGRKGRRMRILRAGWSSVGRRERLKWSKKRNARN